MGSLLFRLFPFAFFLSASSARHSPVVQEPPAAERHARRKAGQAAREDAAQREPSQGEAAPAGPEARGDVALSFVQHLLFCTNRLYARAFHQLHQHTRCPIPHSGPALIAANHTSGLDPAIIQAACPRRIHWLMTREFYDMPHLQWFFTWTRMIPIERAARDSKAWREAIRQLRLGRVVGVFPEGRIERQRQQFPFQPGVALLAIRGASDLFPVYLDGLQRDTPMLHTYIMPQHPSLAWGSPIPAARCNPNRRTLHQLTEALERRIGAMRRRYGAPRVRGRSLLVPKAVCG